MMINFEEIKEKRVIKGTCVNCGKKRSRTVTSCMTVSPFNKNPDGTVRSRDEVRIAVNKQMTEKIEKYTKEFVCSTCKQYI